MSETRGHECPVQECRHMREVKARLDAQERILWLAIGLGIVNVIGGLM